MLEYTHVILAPGVHKILVKNQFLPEDYPAQNVIMNDSQFQRYCDWQSNRKNYLIQEILPDLSLDEREILISGIGANLFDEMFKDEGDSE